MPLPRRLVIACLVSILPLIASFADATTIHVPSGQPTIQAGVDAASQGDTVLVAAGVYVGPGNRDIEIVGKGIVIASEAGSEVTTIDCQDAGGGFVIQAGPGIQVVLQGLTIENGAAIQGAGIFCASTDLVMNDCVLIENWATQRGGGIYTLSSYLIAQGCRFEGNVARLPQSYIGSGGAIFADGSSTHLTSCDVVGNMGYANGGGVYCEGGDLHLDECTVSANTNYEGQGGGLCLSGSLHGSAIRCEFMGNEGADGGAVSTGASTFSFEDCVFKYNHAGPAFSTVGGAIYGGGSLQFIRCVFDGNYASDLDGEGDGGAMYLSNSETTISECTFYGNSASSSPYHIGRGGGLLVGSNATVTMSKTIIAGCNEGEAIYCSPTGSAVLDCSDLFDNAGGDWIGCVASQFGIDGNISDDPLFCDPTAHDFTLDAGSPCAPAQSPAGCGLIGARPVGCGGSGIEATEAPASRLRLLVRPNPVVSRAEFVISGLSTRSTLEIYDAQGRVIDRLTPAGRISQINWSPSRSVPSGVYFARLTDRGGVQTERFVLLR